MCVCVRGIRLRVCARGGLICWLHRLLEAWASYREAQEVVQVLQGLVAVIAPDRAALEAQEVLHGAEQETEEEAEPELYSRDLQ